MGYKMEAKVLTAICLDFETGGLDAVKNPVTQVAMQAVRLDTMEVRDRYVDYVYPYCKKEIGGNKRKVLKTRYELERDHEGKLMEYEQVALDYSGVTMEMLYEKGVELAQVGRNVLDFIVRNTLSKGHQGKPFLIGQNIPFDVGFLMQVMGYTDLTKEFEKVLLGTKDFYGNFQPHYVDTITLAKLAFGGDSSVTSYKLELLCERLGIELSDAHDAEADVTATLNVGRVFVSRLRSGHGMDIALDRQEKSRVHFKI